MLHLAVSLTDLVPQAHLRCLLVLDPFLHELHLSPCSLHFLVLLASKLLELFPRLLLLLESLTHLKQIAHQLLDSLSRQLLCWIAFRILPVQGIIEVGVGLARLAALECHLLLVDVVLESHVLFLILSKLVLNLLLPGLRRMIVCLSRFLLCKVERLEVLTLLEELLNLALELSLLGLGLVRSDVQLVTLLLNVILVCAKL